MTVFLRNVFMSIKGLLNLIVPKNKVQIFFEDMNDIDDNHRVLFEFIVKHNPDGKYKIIYFTKHPERFDKVLFPYTKFVFNDFLGFFYKTRSKYCFYAHGRNRFDCHTVKRQIIFNLWHGSPLKKIAGMISKPPYDESKCFTFFLTPSDFFKPMYKEAFNCKELQFYLGGNPRNDLLIKTNFSLQKMDIERSRYKKIIAFLPTYRNSMKFKTSCFNTSFPILNQNNITFLDSFLGEKQILLIIKLHHAQNNINFANKQYSNIIFLKNEDLNNYKIKLYELLGEMDALITDYSSVYFDYLLTQKPIGFVLDDYDEYKSKRGFTVENPLNIMPGYKIYNFDDFTKFFDLLQAGNDPYIEDRKRINALVNQYSCENNCLSILRFLGLEF